MDNTALVLFLVWAGCIIGSYHLAQAKGHSPWVGAGMGAVLGVLGVLFYLAIGPATPAVPPAPPRPDK